MYFMANLLGVYAPDNMSSAAEVLERGLTNSDPQSEVK